MTHSRMFLYGRGSKCVALTETLERKGFDEATITAVQEGGGKLSQSQMLRTRFSCFFVPFVVKK